MKKKAIAMSVFLLIAWMAVLVNAVFETYTTNIIGGADLPTFQFKLIECLRSPFGIFVQILTVIAIVFYIVLAIKIYLHKKGGKD